MSTKSTEMESLVDRATAAGWSRREGSRAWVLTSPRGDVVSIARTGGGRRYENSLAKLRQAGFEEDEVQLKSVKEAGRKARLEEDRTRAEKRAEKMSAQAAAAAPALPAPAEPEPEPTAIPVAVSEQPPAAATTQTVPVDGEQALIASFKAAGTMYTTTELITPELAEELLTRPAPILPDGRPLLQRSRGEHHVGHLRGIIERGEWMTTPQGLSIAPEPPRNTGGIVDGQHRLYAIVQAGVAVEMRVTWNTPPETFIAHDHGKARTGSDTLKILGETDTLVLASALKLLFCVQAFQADPTGPYIRWANWNRMKPTDHQLESILADNPGLRDHIYPGVKMMRGVKGVPAAGIVFRHIAAQAWPAGLDRLNEFCTSVRDGAMLERDNPALTFRNWVLTGGGRAPGADKRERQLTGLLKSWAKYVQGETYGYVRVDPEMPMPMPYTPRARSRRAA